MITSSVIVTITRFRTEERPGPNGKAPSAKDVPTPCTDSPVSRLLSQPCSIQARILCPSHRSVSVLTKQEWRQSRLLGLERISGYCWPRSLGREAQLFCLRCWVMSCGCRPNCALALAWHWGRIRRLWSEQDTKELQPMLISNLEGTQRREKEKAVGRIKVGVGREL